MRTLPLALLLTFSALTPALPAYADAAATLASWQYVQDPDSGAGFGEISNFIEHHPTWPDQKKIQMRAERMMRADNPSANEVIAWFSEHPPISGIGKWSYAEALTAQHLQEEQVPALVKAAWRDADLTEDEEQKFLSEFGSRITPEDNAARVDRLLWENKITAAERLIPKLPVAKQVMFEARISLMRDAKNEAFLVNQTSAALKNDPGLLYERLRYRVRKNDKSGVRDILLHTPKTVPYPERWWKLRETEVRAAIDEGNYKMAEKLLANHGQADGSSLADALWLSGWIKLEFLNNAQEAYKIFYRMHDNVKTPVSKARAAYWAGRAARKAGDDDAANSWFATAAKNTTTFYGQLALSEMGEAPTLILPDEPRISLFDSDPSFGDDIDEAIRILISQGNNSLATRLINHVIERADNEQSMLAVAELGHKLDAPQISVKAAKKAQQQGVVLKNVGYPRPDTDKDWPIERALTLAIVRQESEFDPRAESPSGALGMMQLLPGTAKETCYKTGSDYDREQLYEPTYNMRLGSHYLSRMIDSYSGSYIMGIASYNGGPGNVRKWSQQFGTPGSEVYGAIDWIEKIPFSETRNYVQRVLENVQVYRALEGDDKLKLKDDLVR